jgi:DNA-binding MarR family transcriptional regulator
MVDPTEDRLRAAIELFYFAYRAFTAGPDQLLEQQGLGRVHHRILYFVGRNPDLTVNALLEILAVSKQALNAPLRQLVERKLVAMRPDEQDRRFRRLRLTDAGRKLETRLTGTQMRHLAAVFTAAGGDAEAAWKSVMQAVPEKSRPRS